MSEFLSAYEEATDRTERYRLLRAEMTRLRAEVVEETRETEGHHEDFFEGEAVRETVAGASERVEGDLVVFLANDFGFPLALRPDGVDLGRQDDVRVAILDGKYDEDEQLAAIRDDVIDAHPRVHKAIVATIEPEGIRYHLPPGSRESNAFLTVREMVGLVDYVTNSAQADSLSRTY